MTLLSRRMLSKTLWAIIGIITFSSSCPVAPPQQTAVSLPKTWAHTWTTASHITGFTFPGMIELPGWVAGSWTSAIPHLGPLAKRRMSLAILNKLTAID